MTSDFSLPGNIEREVADLVVSGREFNVGRRRFRVRRLHRGSMSNVSAEVIPLICRRADGGYVLGLYEDPERDPRSPLLAAFELERVR